MSSDDAKNKVKQPSQLPTSFSSPEIESQDNANSSNNNNESSSVASTTNSSDATTTTTTSMVKSTTTNGLKFNTTRDSGFSDSIVEDTSTSSLSTLRTEHALNVTDSNDINLVTKCFVEKGKLKSVEEDIRVTQTENGLQESNALGTTTTTTLTNTTTDDANKEFITIVKTTKVTTKVKQVKGNGNSKKNKNKNKRRKSFEKSEEDEEDQVATTEEVQQQQQTAQTTTTTSITATTSTLAASNEEESLQININKVGEELIYDNSKEQKEGQQQVPKLDITLLSSSTTETSANANAQVDLNSTVLDCEDILSNYSTNNVGSPRSAPINEVANAVEVLGDVTRSLLNGQPEATATAATDAAAVRFVNLDFLFKKYFALNTLNQTRNFSTKFRKKLQHFS